MMTWVGLSMWGSLLGLIAAAGSMWDEQPRFDRVVTTVITVFLCIPTLWFTIWVLFPLYGIGAVNGL